MAAFESAASSQESSIDYRRLNAAAALRLLFIVIESSPGGTFSFREDEWMSRLDHAVGVFWLKVQNTVKCGLHSARGVTLHLLPACLRV